MDDEANTVREGPAADDPLDRVLFVVSARRYEAFLRLLDAPAPPSPALRALMARRAPWEEPSP